MACPVLYSTMNCTARLPLQRGYAAHAFASVVVEGAQLPPADFGFSILVGLVAPASALEPVPSAVITGHGLRRGDLAQDARRPRRLSESTHACGNYQLRVGTFALRADTRPLAHGFSEQVRNSTTPNTPARTLICVAPISDSIEFSAGGNHPQPATVTANLQSP